MTRTFASAAVVGLGTAGGRLAVALARAGVDVTVVDERLSTVPSPEPSGPQDQPQSRQTPSMQELLSPYLTGPDTGTVLGRLKPVAELTELPAVELAVEAVPENSAAKRTVLQTLDWLCAPDTVIASTVSAIPLRELVTDCALPGRVIGLRAAGPPGTGKLAELVRGPQTDDAVLADVRSLVRRLGLSPVPVADAVGTPLTRLLFGLINRSARMVGRGYVFAADVDAALELGCGLPGGALRCADEIGLDTVVDVLTELHARTADSVYRVAPLLSELVADGRLGRQSGAGFHRYPMEPGPPAAATPGGPVAEGGPRHVGILGSGVMAAGIAGELARAGFQVTVVARSRQALDRMRTGMSEADPAPGWHGATSTAALADCDLVIESVLEDLAVKQSLLAELDRVCAPHTVLATGTSSLSVADCGAGVGVRRQLVGLHFFNPVPSMNLVEVVHTGQTSGPVPAVMDALCRRLGKRPLHCGDEPGFVVNRLLFPLLNDALGLLSEGWPAADIDRCVKLGTGLPMGPFRLLDVVGTDVALAVLTNLAQTEDGPHPLLTRLVADGFLGQKIGRCVREHPEVAGVQR